MDGQKAIYKKHIWSPEKSLRGWDISSVSLHNMRFFLKIHVVKWHVPYMPHCVSLHNRHLHFIEKLIFFKNSFTNRFSIKKSISWIMTYIRTFLQMDAFELKKEFSDKTKIRLLGKLLFMITLGRMILLIRTRHVTDQLPLHVGEFGEIFRIAYFIPLQCK